MYIHTYTKATPQEIRALDGRKLDDFSKLRRKKVKINKSPPPRNQLPASSNPESESLILRQKKFAFTFKSSPTKELRVRKKEGTTQNKKSEIFDNLKNIVEKNAFKYPNFQRYSFSDAQRQVEVRGKTANKSERLPSQRHSPRRMRLEQQAQINKSNEKTLRKIYSKMERRNPPEDPTFMKNYRRSMSSEMKARFNKNINFEELLTNEPNEPEIRPWAIHKQEDSQYNLF